jgi:hypothetical protein
MNLPLFDCCLPCRGSRDHRPVCIYSPHIASRFPFCLWLCSFRFCDSAAHLLVCRAPFPRLLCRKALAMVGVSLPSEETVNIAFLQFRGLSLFDSSGVFYLFKECSSRAPSEITLYPLTSPWAGLIVGDLWQIAPNKFWALRQTGFSCNDTAPPGPIVGCCALGFSRSRHLPSFGLTADGPCGLHLVCHNLGKKWASTIFNIVSSFIFCLVPYIKSPLN